MPETTEKKSSKKLLILILAIAAAAVLIIVFAVVLPAGKNAKYNNAVALMEAEQYEEARKAFLEMGDYRDAPALAEECVSQKQRLDTYTAGKAEYESGKWRTAIETLTGLGNYKDSESIIRGCNQHLDYEGAAEDLDKGRYEAALSVFEELGDFEDSRAKAEECRGMIQKKTDYDAAVKLYEEEDFKSAKSAFEALGDYADAKDFVQMCSLLTEYRKAETSFSQAFYEDAKAMYEEILEQYADADTILAERGDVTASERIDHCKAELAFFEARDLFDAGDYEMAAKKIGEIEISDLTAGDHAGRAKSIVSYAGAMKDYDEGLYYEAYEGFKNADSIGNSDEMAQKCIQATPETGETYRNPNYGSSDTSLTIYPPSDDGNHNYIKLYTTSGELVSALFIRSGDSGYVDLPAGEYVIKVAYGPDPWWGEKDMFGDEGNYYVLNLGSGEVVELSGGYAWELTLRTAAAEGQSMGEESIGRDSF